MNIANRAIFLAILGSLLVSTSLYAGPEEANAPEVQLGVAQPAEPQNNQGRIGLADFKSAQTLSNLFNPSLSFAGDFAFSWSEKSGRQAGADGFMLRGAELGLFGAVDNFVEYHGVVHFDEEDIELEEAYVRASEWLPSTFSLKAGRFNLDFGKQAPVHDHDLKTLDKPSVLQEYLGGSVRGTGVELGWWTPVGEQSLIRASFGAFQTAESDAHVILGPAAGHHHDEDEEEEDLPIRDIKDFACSARLTALVDVSDNSTLQLGTSYLYAPTRTFGVDETMDHDIDHSAAGVDLSWVQRNEESGQQLTLQSEWIMNRQDFGEVDDNGTPMNDADDFFVGTSERASGFYFLGDYQFSKKWAVGCSYNLYEHAEDSGEESYDAGVYVTHHINEYNRLRFETRYFNDLAFEDEGVEDSLDFVAFTVQWTVILGSHGHGLDW